MGGMSKTDTPPTKSPSTRNVERAEGEWVEDHEYPVLLVAGGEIRYGVVRDGGGQIWGRWCFVKGGK